MLPIMMLFGNLLFVPFGACTVSHMLFSWRYTRTASMDPTTPSFPNWTNIVPGALVEDAMASKVLV